MDKILNFDQEFKQNYRSLFVIGKIGVGCEGGCGLALMMIPMEEIHDVQWVLLIGWMLCAASVSQYMQMLLCVREDNKMVSVSKKLAYMPVTNKQIRKVRIKYLNRYCVRLGAAAIFLQMLASWLNDSLGWKSVWMMLGCACLMWVFNLIPVYFTLRE